MVGSYANCVTLGSVRCARALQGFLPRTRVCGREPLLALTSSGSAEATKTGGAVGSGRRPRRQGKGRSVSTGTEGGKRFARRKHGREPELDGTARRREDRRGTPRRAPLPAPDLLEAPGHGDQCRPSPPCFQNQMPRGLPKLLASAGNIPSSYSGEQTPNASRGPHLVSASQGRLVCQHSFLLTKPALPCRFSQAPPLPLPPAQPAGLCRGPRYPQAGMLPGPLLSTQHYGRGTDRSPCWGVLSAAGC